MNLNAFSCTEHIIYRQFNTWKLLTVVSPVRAWFVIILNQESNIRFKSIPATLQGFHLIQLHESNTFIYFLQFQCQSKLFKNIELPLNFIEKRISGIYMKMQKHLYPTILDTRIIN